MRITGTRVAHVTTARLAGEFQDYPNDPRQSSLYNWWKEEARKIGNINEKAQDMIAKLEACEESLNTLIQDSQNSNNLNHAQRGVSEARTAISTLINAVNEAKNTLDSSRIPASLKRFDQWFWNFLKSQNLRWFSFDFLAPILLGLAAIFLLSNFGQKLVC